MADINLQVKDATGTVKFLKESGVGTDADPHVGHVVLEAGANVVGKDVNSDAIKTDVDHLDMNLSALRDAITKTGELANSLADVVAALGATLKVQGASDGTPLPVADAGGSLTVDIDQTSPGVTNGVMVNGVGACKLVKGGTPAADPTLASAGTDYPLGSPMPVGAKYVTVYSLYDVKVAMGEVTDATHGVWVAGGLPTTCAVTYSDSSEDVTPHFQSAVAGAVVTCTWMHD